MLVIKSGASRVVILLNKYAIKVPRIDSWRLFLYGLLGNIHEKQWQNQICKYLCPILFYVPGGFLSIMPRCEVKAGLSAEFIKIVSKDLDTDISETILNIVEDKDDSVGILNGKIVAIDYGS